MSEEDTLRLTLPAPLVLVEWRAAWEAATTDHVRRRLALLAMALTTPGDLGMRALRGAGWDPVEAGCAVGDALALGGYDVLSLDLHWRCAAFLLRPVSAPAPEPDAPVSDSGGLAEDPGPCAGLTLRGLSWDAWRRRAGPREAGEHMVWRMAAEAPDLAAWWAEHGTGLGARGWAFRARR